MLSVLRDFVKIVIVLSMMQLAVPSVYALELVQTPYTILHDPMIKQSLQARIRFISGLKLEGKNSKQGFGGFSALTINKEKQITAFSDRNGLVFRADLALNPEDNSIRLFNTRLQVIKSKSGKPLSDIESVAVINDHYYIAFDDSNEIMRFDSTLNFIEVYSTLSGYAQLPNAGIEALTGWPDKTILAIAEKQTGDRGQYVPYNARRVWFILDNQRMLLKTYLTLGPRNPSAAVTLDNQDVIVLERAYVSARNLLRFVLLDYQQIHTKSVLKGDELASLIPVDDLPNPLDNGEALAQFKKDGQQYLLLMTDNNFNEKQKTLLLLFSLD